MKIQKYIYLVLIFLVLLSLSAVSAADDSASDIISTNQEQELILDESINEDASANDELILEENSAENKILTEKTNIDSDETEQNLLDTSTGSYSDLRSEIGSGGDITLTKKEYRYTEGDGDDGTITISNAGVINGNGAVIDMAGSNICAFYVSASGVTITNMTIKNANYNGYGGAIEFRDSGTVINCNFIGNTAVGGGAIYSYYGNVQNCNFTYNNANKAGGAVLCDSGTVTNCNFIGNTATQWGGALWMGYGSVENCNFTNNSANQAGAILSRDWFGITVDTCILKTSSDTTYNTNNIPPILTVDDFTTSYGSGEKIAFDLKTNITSIPVNDGNITISVYFKNNDSWVGNYSCLSGEGWAVDLPAGSYYAIYNTEYDGFEPINRSIQITLATSVDVNNKTLDLFIGDTFTIVATTTPEGLPVSFVPDDSGVYSVDENGNVIALREGKGSILIKVGGDGIYAENSTIVNVTVSKIPTEITANDITTSYNINKDLVISLKDSAGKALSGVKVTVDLNGAKEYTTDSNGQVKVSTKGLAIKSYTVKVSFAGNESYMESNTTAKVTIQKATPKITASAKTFKFEDKTKKYTITLKDNKGNVLKNTKVSLKVNGKTYTAKTNSKGVATFKLTKLTKKGTYTAAITYAGDKCYKKVTKKAKITVKAPAKKKSTWKTLSKGSKDKATVKKIQRALKNNGYYLTYKGHYLKIDGIYKGCTERSVKQFQKAKGLKVTGKVDYATAKKLKIV